MATTSYGIKQKGESRFIIVAPHAAGDDFKTREIAEIIGNQLKASFVVNKNYIKRSNSRAKSKPNMVRDFNKLSFKNGRYFFGKKKASQDAKNFYNDIMHFIKAIHQKKEKPVIVFIHGMRNGKDRINIDIGFGAKKYKGKLLGTKGTKKYPRHPEADSNTGLIRANRKLMITLGYYLSKQGWEIGFGEAERFDKKGRKLQFAAWSRTNGIQYFAKKLIKIPTYSFQLEIDRGLRNKSKLKNISEIIAKVLKEIY